jgi:hypothetical protein
MRTATALWRISPDLVLAVDEHLGTPVDCYVNGSQTWFTGEPVLEWRLHPVAGYEAPVGVSPYDLWELVAAAIGAGADPAGITIGSSTVALDALWDGLECFPAYGDEMEPAAVVQRARDVLHREPDLSGLVDHDAVGDEWERTGGAISVVDLLIRELGA